MEPHGLDRFRTGKALHGCLMGELLEEGGPGTILDAGDQVGPWRVLELLGSGGMSRVYLAERSDGAFEQRVALKLVRGRPELSDRLRHERRIVAGLRHPHIVSLVDGGETADGILWFAMALVEGKPIDEHVRACQQDWRARLQLFDAVCSAVQYAHDRGLIHRDLKPDNILVDSQGHPRLLDFGIALDGQGHEAASDRALTPGFASPEQLAGEALDIRSDVYQLGLVLRMLLDVPVPAGAAPVPASVRRDLEAVCSRAIAFDRGARYATVAALREDLAQLLARRPLAHQRDDVRVRLALAVERHRLAAIVAVAAVLTLSVGLLTSALRLNVEHDQALAHAARASAVAKFLVDTLSQANPHAADQRQVSVLEAVDFAVSRLETELADSPEVRRELHTTIGEVYLSLDEAQRCLDLLGSAPAGADRADAPALQQVRLAILHSECHIALDQRDAALAQLDRADTALEGHSGRDAEALRSFVLVDRGQILSLGDRLREANALFEQALVLARRAGDAQQEYRATRMLAGNLQNFGDDLRAAELLQRALVLARQTLGPKHRSTLTASGLLAMSLARLERWDEAERVIQEAITVAAATEHRAGPAEMVLAQLRDSYANVLWQQNRLSECIDQASQSLAIYRRIAPPESTQGFNPSWRVATCAYQIGDWQQARIHAEAALGYASNGVPVGRINALRMLAAVALRSADMDSASDYLRRADDAFASTEVASPTVATALALTHARLSAAAKDMVAARAQLADADARIQRSGQNPPWLRQERGEVAALLEADRRASGR
jgi:serine/threonine-protein kinase